MKEFYTYNFADGWTLTKWRRGKVYILTVPSGTDIKAAKEKLATIPGHTIFIVNPVLNGTEIFFKSILTPSHTREEVASLFSLHKCSHKRKVGKHYKRPIYQYTLDDKFIKKWDGVVDIVRELGYNQGNVVSCARGRYKQAYGFLWKYT